MNHDPTTLERIFAANEGITTPDIVFADINAALEAEVEELRSVERTIMRRVRAMLQYVFGVCQKKSEKRPTAEKAMKDMELVISRNVTELIDPQSLMEDMAMEEMFKPDVAEALASAESQTPSRIRKNDASRADGSSRRIIGAQSGVIAGESYLSARSRGGLPARRGDRHTTKLTSFPGT